MADDVWKGLDGRIIDEFLWQLWPPSRRGGMVRQHRTTEQKLEDLARRGATEGERDAARRALDRLRNRRAAA